MAELLAESEAQRPPYDFLSIGLLPSDRAVLHERIAQRFDAMLAAGLEDEVTMLRERYDLHLGLPSMRCVGYRQVWEAQDGIIPFKEIRDRGVFATRQLAKRQITWLTNSLAAEAFDCLDLQLSARVTERVAAFLKP
jgi:tRNA dimethylallyltransferase